MGTVCEGAKFTGVTWWAATKCIPRARTWRRTKGHTRVSRVAHACFARYCSVYTTLCPILSLKYFLLVLGKQRSRYLATGGSDTSRPIIDLSFMFCWPCLLVRLWVNDQLDVQLRYIICLLLLLSATWFEQLHAHHQEVNYINIQPKQFLLNLHTGRSLTENNVPGAVLIQFDLLMMSTVLLETCRGL